MKFINVLLLIAGLFLLNNCSKDTPLEQQPNPGIKLSHFSEIQQQVLTPLCASSGCHSGGSPKAGLNLQSGKAYSALVNVPSSQNPGMLRVKPGDADHSYLIDKHTGNGTAQIPLGGTPLSSATIDSIKNGLMKAPRITNPE